MTTSSFAAADPAPLAAATCGEGAPHALPAPITEEAPALERRGVDSSGSDEIRSSGALHHGHNHDGVSQ